MKFISDRLSALARGITGASRSWSGDAELIVDPRVALVAELPAPLHTASPNISIVQEDSFFATIFPGAQLGVAIANDNVAHTFARGLWRINGIARFQFTGTVNTGSYAWVSLVDPASLEFRLAEVLLMQQPLIQYVKFEALLSLTEANWRFNLHRPATVVGDVLDCSLRASCQRIF
jgi:hypothetical protein